MSFTLGSRLDSHQEVLRKDDHLSVGQCGRVHPASPRPVFSQMRLGTWQVRQAGRARTRRDHPAGWGRCWQDGLSCSCWAAVQGDRQNTVRKGVETEQVAAWRQSATGEMSGGPSSIWQEGVLASRWATAVSNPRGGL